jgi:hypothetical protein
MKPEDIAAMLTRVQDEDAPVQFTPEPVQPSDQVAHPEPSIAKKRMSTLLNQDEPPTDESHAEADDTFAVEEPRRKRGRQSSRSIRNSERLWDEVRSAALLITPQCWLDFETVEFRRMKHMQGNFRAVWEGYMADPNHGDYRVITATNVWKFLNLVHRSTPIPTMENFFAEITAARIAWEESSRAFYELCQGSRRGMSFRPVLTDLQSLARAAHALVDHLVSS